MKIRDARNKEWFWLDNEYLNGYARHLGATCTVVYISLCRHADNESQSCFPSMEMIAKENGISEKSVSRSIRKLAEWNIVLVDESYDAKSKRRRNNVYTLLAKTEWKKKPNDIHQTISPVESHRTYSPEPPDKYDQSHRTQSPSNNTHINNTHITIATTSVAVGIGKIIKSFEEINPACKNYYQNTTQRRAVDDLIKSYGFDRVKSVVDNTLPKTNKIAYMPTIATPVQLRDKWAALEAAIYKERDKNKAKRTIV